MTCLEIVSTDIARKQLASVQGTWREQLLAKEAWYEYGRFFWQTPLASGFKEQQEDSDVHDVFQPGLLFALRNFPRVFHTSLVFLFRSLSLLLRIALRFRQTISGSDFVPAQEAGKILAALKLSEPPVPLPNFGLISGTRVRLPGGERSVRLNLNSVKYGYMRQLLADLRLGDFSQGTIVEIGGGYGGLAHELVDSYGNSGTRYVIVDLSSSLFVACQYLRAALPGRTVQMVLADEELPQDPGFYLVSPETYLSGIIRADLVINSESFSEMSSKDIAKYFSAIQQSGRARYFLNRNREKRQEQGEWRYFEDFPYDSDWNHIFDGRCEYSDSAGFSAIRFRISERL